jgi:hypothetical protein
MVQSKPLATSELPLFWQEIWREAERRNPEPTHQSLFNDGAHFVINALKDAAKEIIRLRKIDDLHDGPWEDESAFALFNRQITEAYIATENRWSEIVGVEVVDAMWAIPDDPVLAAAESDAHQMAARLREIRERCEAASPGPWEYERDAVYTSHACGSACPIPLHDHFVFADPDTKPADVAFIAHAREDVPFLLARIAELEQADTLNHWTCARCGYVAPPSKREQEKK